MTDLRNAIWIELRKVTRSKMPLLTLLGLLMLPLACAFLMFVYKDPEFARRIGLISAKANLAGGSATWPFYLNMYAQGIGIAGIILFSLNITWVFGREFVDGTVKDMLAVPVPRGVLVAAKFIVLAVWSALLIAIVYGVGLALGALIGMPQGTTAVMTEGTITFAVTAGLVCLVVFPVALLASVGRGYLLPMGITFLILALANIIALIGWGSYFPWSIPGLYAGMTGKGGHLEIFSLWIVLFTGLAGIMATYWWWKQADQNR